MYPKGSSAGFLNSPGGWSLVNVFFFETPSVKIQRGTHQEIIAKYIYERRRSIEILKSVAGAQASINQEEVSKTLKQLANEIAPELKEEDAKSLKKMEKLVEGEQGKVYNIVATDGIKNTKGRIIKRRKNKPPWRKR